MHAIEISATRSTGASAVPDHAVLIALIVTKSRSINCVCCLQSLVLAGLFAWMEGLFAIGYRPKLHAELKRRVEENIARNKAQQEAQAALLTG